MLMFVVAGGLAGAFWGAVLAFILKWLRKPQKFAWWPVVLGAVAGATFGLLKVLSYG